ncbi:MAG: hypothetical protein ACXADB_14970 [Candidatus Hermodarchaeia archaeon]|jgi:hypothetical protein
MNASQFNKQWRDYADKYTQWYAPVKKYQDDYMKERGLNWGDYEQINKAVLAFREARLAQDNLPGEIYDFIDQHIHIYMEATPGEREEIRSTKSCGDTLGGPNVILLRRVKRNGSPELL